MADCETVTVKNFFQVQCHTSGRSPFPWADADGNIQTKNQLDLRVFRCLATVSNSANKHNEISSQDNILRRLDPGVVEFRWRTACRISTASTEQSRRRRIFAAPSHFISSFSTQSLNNRLI